MSELCRNGKCKRRGRKRKSEASQSDSIEEYSEEEQIPVLKERRLLGRPRKQQQSPNDIVLQPDTIVSAHISHLVSPSFIRGEENGIDIRTISSSSPPFNEYNLGGEEDDEVKYSSEELSSEFDDISNTMQHPPSSEINGVSKPPNCTTTMVSSHSTMNQTLTSQQCRRVISNEGINNNALSISVTMPSSSNITPTSSHVPMFIYYPSVPLGMMNTNMMMMTTMANQYNHSNNTNNPNNPNNNNINNNHHNNNTMNGGNNGSLNSRNNGSSNPDSSLDHDENDNDSLSQDFPPDQIDSDDNEASEFHKVPSEHSF